MRPPIFRSLLLAILGILSCRCLVSIAAAQSPAAPYVTPLPIPPSLGGDGALPSVDIDPGLVQSSPDVPQNTPRIYGVEPVVHWNEYSIEWSNQPPPNPPVTLLGYIIQRREGPLGWQDVHEIPYDLFAISYTDRTIKVTNRRYHYRIVPKYEIASDTYYGPPSNVVCYLPSHDVIFYSKTQEISYEPLPESEQPQGFRPFEGGTADVCENGKLYRTKTINKRYNSKRDEDSETHVTAAGTWEEIDTYTGNGGQMSHSGKKSVQLDYVSNQGYDENGKLTQWFIEKLDVTSIRKSDGSWGGWAGLFLHSTNYESFTNPDYFSDVWWRLAGYSYGGHPIIFRRTKHEVSATRDYTRFAEKIETTPPYYHELTEETVIRLSNEISAKERFKRVAGPWSNSWLENGPSCATLSEPNACNGLSDETILAYRHAFPYDTEKAMVRWAAHYMPPSGAQASSGEMAYYSSEFGPEKKTNPSEFLHTERPGTICIVPYTVKLDASDYRGLADEEEKKTRGTCFYGEESVSANGPETVWPVMSGVTILVHPTGQTIGPATLNLKVNGGVVGPNWKSTLTWDRSQIKVYSSAPTAPYNQTELSSPVIYTGLQNREFLVVANGAPERSLVSTVKLSVQDEKGARVGEDLVRLHVVRWPAPPPPEEASWDERVTFSDAVGSRYRKIGLNGRPIGDSKPQTEPESDEPREETYVDAFSLGLVHSTSDIYIPIPGSQLTLSARRNVQSEIWNLKSGLRPHERLDRPFGAGWGSNLVSYIEFTHPEGSAADDGRNPTEAIVHDEEGGEHRFVMYEKNGATGWVPFVTAKNNARAYLTSLEMSGGQWVFKRKYGNTLYFNKGSSPRGEIAYASLRSDRLEGRGDGTVDYSYSRLDRVEDRLGYRLVYTYPGNTLIPCKIHVEKADHTPFPGLQIYIRQADQKRITQIWDPSGNTTVYSYETRSAPSHPVTGASQSVPLLKSVSHSDHALPPREVGGATYDYNSGLSAADEEPPTLPKRSGILSAPNLHLDITKIGDRLGNDWQFIYDFDHTKEIYVTTDDETDYYKQNGLPRWITTIVPPEDENSKQVYFKNFTDIRLTQGASLQFDKLTGTDSPTSPPVRKTQVIDALGNPTTYTFDGNKIVTLVAFRELKFGRNDPADKFFDPRLVYFTEMQIEHGSIGTETFTFKPEAGLALSFFRDLCGNETQFFYENQISVPTWLSDIYPSGTTLFTYWDDVTRQVRKLDGVEKTRSYTYSTNHRIMESLTDEEGRVTFYAVDLKGRRTSERVYAPGNHDLSANPPVLIGTPVSETITEYHEVLQSEPGAADPVDPLPSFVVRQTLKRRSDDPSWAQDMVTEFAPDYLLDYAGNAVLDNGKLQFIGRVASQTTYPFRDADDNLVNPLVTRYTYDFNNNRTSVTDPKNKTTVFTYDGFNRLVQATYHNWDFESRGYDLRGKLISKKLFDSTQNRVRESKYSYDALGRRIAAEDWIKGDEWAVTGYAYNSVGSLISITDPRNKVTYHDYDALQRLISTKDALGKVTTYAYDLAKNAGASGFDTSGFKPTRVKDARGFLTEFVYDDFYRLKQTRAEWKKGSWAVTTNVYDDVGNLTDVTDALGKVTHTIYDTLNRPTSVTFAYDTNEAIKTTASYTGTGLKWQTALLGIGSSWSWDSTPRVTETHFDLAGRAIRVVHPEVMEGQAIDKTFYDAAGNIARTVDGRGKERDYQYDDRHRRTEEQLPAVLDALAVSPSTLTGTSARPKTTINGHRADGLQTSVTDPKGKTTEFYYDGLGRLTLTVFPAGFGETSTKYDANGNVLEVLDPENKKTVNTYDALNRLLTSTNPEDITVSYTYDAEGNRTSVTDGLNQTTRFEYDGLGRLTDEIDPANKTKRFLYDAVNKTRQIDPLGQVTDYQYDDLHRLRQVLQLGASTAENWSYDYDVAGNLRSATPGQGGIRTTGYTYDARNQRRTETSADITHTYGYDLAGNRTSLSTDDVTGFLVEYEFDDAGRLSKVIQGDGLTTYQYDLNGNAHRLVLPNGERTITTHDALNRVLIRKGFTPANAAAETTPAYAYAYLNDKAGNVKTITEDYFDDRLPDRVITNLYDNAYRLEKETIVTVASGAIPAKTAVTDYVYDEANNRAKRTVTTDDGSTTTQVETSYTYNRLNQLTGTVAGYGNNITQNTYRYDANGNRTGRTIRPPAPASATTTGYVYDRDNRLIEVVEDASEEFVTIKPQLRPGRPVQASYFTEGTRYQYRYDHRTRRVERTEPESGGATTTRVTFAGGVSVAEYPGTSITPDVRYVRGADIGGGVGGMLYSLRGSNGPLYSHYNARGDVIARTKGDVSTYAVDYAAAYEAFGKIPEKTGTNADRFAANSKEQDPTGLLNEGFRYRDLDTGTFLTRDPLGFVDGPNMYTYVVQNPWSKFDPLGLRLVDAGNGLQTWVSDGPPCIQCHGVSAGGFNGNVNSFAGLAAIPGSGPRAAEGYHQLRNAAIYGTVAVGTGGVAGAVAAPVAGAAGLTGLANAAATGFVSGAVADLSVQTAQMETGDRDAGNYDLKQAATSGAVGAVGGVILAKGASLLNAEARAATSTAPSPTANPAAASKSATSSGGALTQAEYDALIADINFDKTTLYHGGELRGGAISSNRSLSTTTELAYAELHAAKTPGGSVYRFDVPNATMRKWDVVPAIDNYGGVAGSEIRIPGSIVPELNQYRVPHK